ncbi:MAG TPA: Lrp/AsnC family transcriptional regulator [Azospirillaceae bacterium]|nr:Lrp/AsnC family transcriptional regulator [Azospirillaceae bacterium]
MQLDETDTALLRQLEMDGRLPAATLARRLKLSRTTVQARIDRLLAGGVIAGFTVRHGDVYRRALAQGLVMITVAPKRSATIEARLRAMPEVRALHAVSGPFDMIAHVAAMEIGELDRVIDAIGMLDGVERTTSSIILSTRMSR